MRVVESRPLSRTKRWRLVEVLERAEVIQNETRLRVADNTGAREILCIRVEGGSRRRYAGVGRHHHRDGQAGRRRRARSRRARSSRAVVVRTKKSFGRDDGTYIAFDENAAVIIDAAEQPARHAHLRPGRPRAARPQLHEDRLARPGGALTMASRLQDPAATTRSSSSAARTAARPASVLRVDPKKERVYVEGLNIVKRHQRPRPGSHRARRRHREGGPDPHLQRHAARSRRTTSPRASASSARTASATAWPGGPGSRHRLMRPARLKERYHEEIRPRSSSASATRRSCRRRRSRRSR